MINKKDKIYTFRAVNRVQGIVKKMREEYDEKQEMIKSGRELIKQYEQSNMNKVIVGIDLGVHVGITRMESCKTNIRHITTKSFEPATFGIKMDEIYLYQYMSKLEQLLLAYHPDLVVFEDYIHSKRFFNVQVSEMVGQLKRCLVDNNIDYLCVHPNMLKKINLGVGKVADGKVVKEAQKFVKDYNYKLQPDKLNVHMADSLLFARTGYQFLNNKFPKKDMKTLKECLVTRRKDEN